MHGDGNRQTSGAEANADEVVDIAVVGGLEVLGLLDAGGTILVAIHTVAVLVGGSVAVGVAIAVAIVGREAAAGVGSVGRRVAVRRHDDR